MTAGNRVAGESILTVNDRDYKLVFSFDALCVMEQITGMGMEEIWRALQAKPRLSLLRSIFYAGLKEHNPEVTERIAGELIGLAGLPAVVAAIEATMKAAWPADKGGGGNGMGDPQKTAGRGIGNDSANAPSKPD